MNELLTCILCGLYAEVGLQAQASPPKVPPGWQHHLYDRNAARNPYGTIELGYEVQVSPRVRATLALRHESSLVVDGYEFGEDSVALRVRFTPWRRQ